MVNSATDTAPTRRPRLQVAAHPAAASALARVVAPPRRAPSCWRLAVPSLLTAAGLALGLAGAALLPSTAGALLLLASLALDAADGAAARLLGASTAAGGAFDLATDRALAHAVAWACWPRAAAPVSALLVALVTLAPMSRRLAGGRVSGRVLVTLAAVAWCWLAREGRA